MRQSETRRLRNRQMKTQIKTLVKGVRVAVQQKDQGKAREFLARVIPLIDKAASRGIIHKRTRSRKISRLMRLVNTMGESA